MIDFSKLNFGDSVYNIIDNLHAFNRKKIFKTDEEGVEWYRYDKPIRSFTIHTFTYVGRAESHTFGQVIPEDVNETMYFVESNELKEMTYLHERDVDDSDWFASKEEAEAEVIRRADEQSKTDRS